MGENGLLDHAGSGLGDLVVALLSGTLAGVRDRLYVDGYRDAADLVADLVDMTDEYLARVST